MNYISIYNEVTRDKTGNLFSQSPKMIQDMFRTHAYYKDSINFNKLQKPMLRVHGGCSYTYSLDDVYNGLLFLYERGIKSFIVLEDSTYTLQLLYTILEINNTRSKFTVSIHENFTKVIEDRWQQPMNINGIVVNLIGRKIRRGQSLPQNIIS